MLVRGLNCHLIGTEGSSPPLPHIEVSDGEGAVLVRMKLAEEVTEEAVEAPKKAPKKAEKAPEPPKAPQPPKEPETAPEAANEPETAPETAKEPETAPEHSEARIETIVHALDLVEGEPTVDAVAEISGLADVTAEEIAAAVTAKESAEA